jgi:hypothetical protein
MKNLHQKNRALTHEETRVNLIHFSNEDYQHKESI